MKENEGLSKPTVPPQEEGAAKDIEYSVNAVDDGSARRIFEIASNRLKNVNSWSHYSGVGSATFRLSDSHGQEVNRAVQKADLFKIELPAAPGSSEGDGYDWVKVEAIEHSGGPNSENEVIAIRVRPTPSPLSPGNATAHFFSDRATSSFVLERTGKKISAAVYGRNEIPNIETPSVVDKVRNAIVGSTAIIGMSNLQWKSLVKGLLEAED